MHNVVKKMTSFFDYYLENLFRDISNEIEYQAVSLFLLEEVTFYMGKKFRKPITYNACRWLSVDDVSVTYNNEPKKVDSKNNQLKACVRYFLSNFYFSPNDSPSKTTKNIFYFI